MRSQQFKAAQAQEFAAAERKARRHPAGKAGPESGRRARSRAAQRLLRGRYTPVQFGASTTEELLWSEVQVALRLVRQYAPHWTAAIVGTLKGKKTPDALRNSNDIIWLHDCCELLFGRMLTAEEMKQFVGLDMKSARLVLNQELPAEWGAALAESFEEGA